MLRFLVLLWTVLALFSGTSLASSTSTLNVDLAISKALVSAIQETNQNDIPDISVYLLSAEQNKYYRFGHYRDEP